MGNFNKRVCDRGNLVKRGGKGRPITTAVARTQQSQTTCCLHPGCGPGAERNSGEVTALARWWPVERQGSAESLVEARGGLE